MSVGRQYVLWWYVWLAPVFNIFAASDEGIQTVALVSDPVLALVSCTY